MEFATIFYSGKQHYWQAQLMFLTAAVLMMNQYLNAILLNYH
jgi:hypothetical protein